ncbi:UNVERIFIED_CONTAM: hypothetical protein FKN15_050909, partial [Acipenser sinensis]
NCASRVDLYYRGQWGAVCWNDFGINEAHVACRQAGCGEAETYSRFYVHIDDAPIWLDRVRCTGNETNLWDCPSDTWGHHECDLRMQAAVACKALAIENICVTGAVNLSLADGGSPCAGRLEYVNVVSKGSFHDDAIDASVAQALCWQLDCGSAVSVKTGAYFGETPGTLWTLPVHCNGNESSFWQCKADVLFSVDVVDYPQKSKFVGVVCSGHRAPRLVDGEDSCSGRVEVQFGETWGTLCDTHWDMHDASVVCNQLQCGVAVATPGGAHFGEGRGPMLEEQFDCWGNESILFDCPVSRKDHSCTHGSHAAVICSGKDGPQLVGGGSRCSGRVEILHGGLLGAVCDEYLDPQDADVICRHLHCGAATSTPKGVHFGEGTGRAWKDSFHCRGNESRLGDCMVSWDQQVCDHGSDASIICAEEDWMLRLRGGESRCEGSVEVFLNSTWGRVSDSEWDLQDASVVCRHLNCGLAIEAYNSSKYAPGNGPVLLSQIECKGNESSLQGCYFSQSNESAKSSVSVGVLCTEHLQVRLAGSGSQCAGRVEVYHRGSWGTVCDGSWDLPDADVACRQLGCGPAVQAPVSAAFGEGSGPVWLSDVKCLGNESALWECPSAKWGEQNCRHKKDAGVVCSEFKDLRLVSAEFDCAGRLEIFYNGTWGSVCSNKMSSTTVNMICQQLGCGGNGTLQYTNQFGAGSGPKWLDEVDCHGFESVLWQCPSLPWGQNTCQDSEVAGIECLEGQVRLVGADSPCSGRVELCYSGSWGTVCDDSWDLNDAQVVCTQLLCGSAVTATQEARFGEGNGTIWLDDVNCRGTEMFLLGCRSSTPGLHNCEHNEDAGVICSAELPESRCEDVGSDTEEVEDVPQEKDAEYDDTEEDDYVNETEDSAELPESRCEDVGSDTEKVEDVPQEKDAEYDDIEENDYVNEMEDSAELPDAGYDDVGHDTHAGQDGQLDPDAEYDDIEENDYINLEENSAGSLYDDTGILSRRLRAELPESRCEDVGSDTEKVEDVPQEKDAEYDDIEENDYVNEMEDSAELPDAGYDDVGHDTHAGQDGQLDPDAEYDDIEENDYINLEENSAGSLYDDTGILSRRLRAELPESRCEDVGSDTEKVEDVPQEKDAEYDDIEENDYVNEMEDSAELPDAGYDDVGHDTHAGQDGQLDPDAEYDDIEENDYINLEENSAGSLYDDTGILSRRLRDLINNHKSLHGDAPSASGCMAGSWRNPGQAAARNQSATFPATYTPQVRPYAPRPAMHWRKKYSLNNQKAGPPGNNLSIAGMSVCPTAAITAAHPRGLSTKGSNAQAVTPNLVQPSPFAASIQHTGLRETGAKPVSAGVRTGLATPISRSNSSQIAGEQGTNKSAGLQRTLSSSSPAGGASSSTGLVLDTSKLSFLERAALLSKTIGDCSVVTGQGQIKGKSPVMVRTVLSPQAAGGASFSGPVPSVAESFTPDRRLLLSKSADSRNVEAQGQSTDKLLPQAGHPHSIKRPSVLDKVVLNPKAVVGISNPATAVPCEAQVESKTYFIDRTASIHKPAGVATGLCSSQTKPSALSSCSAKANAEGVLQADNKPQSLTTLPSGVPLSASPVKNSKYTWVKKPEQVLAEPSKARAGTSSTSAESTATPVSPHHHPTSGLAGNIFKRRAAAGHKSHKGPGQSARPLKAAKTRYTWVSTTAHSAKPTRKTLSPKALEGTQKGTKSLGLVSQGPRPVCSSPQGSQDQPTRKTLSPKALEGTQKGTKSLGLKKSVTPPVAKPSKKASASPKPSGTGSKYRWKAATAGQAAAAAKPVFKWKSEQENGTRGSPGSPGSGKPSSAEHNATGASGDSSPSLSGYKLKSRMKIIRKNNSPGSVGDRRSSPGYLTVKTRFSLRRRGQVPGKRLQTRGLIPIGRHKLRRLPSAGTHGSARQGRYQGK